MKRQILKLSQQQVLAAVTFVLNDTDFKKVCMADVAYGIARKLGFKL